MLAVSLIAIGLVLLIAAVFSRSERVRTWSHSLPGATTQQGLSILPRNSPSLSRMSREVAMAQTDEEIKAELMTDSYDFHHGEMIVQYYQERPDLVATAIETFLVNWGIRRATRTTELQTAFWRQQLEKARIKTELVMQAREYKLANAELRLVDLEIKVREVELGNRLQKTENKRFRLENEGLRLEIQKLKLLLEKQRGEGDLRDEEVDRLLRENRHLKARLDNEMLKAKIRDAKSPPRSAEPIGASTEKDKTEAKLAKNLAAQDRNKQAANEKIHKATGGRLPEEWTENVWTQVRRIQNEHGEIDERLREEEMRIRRKLYGL